MRQYLDECLHSLAVQDWPNIEVIVVDDGSNDSSGEIAEQVAATDRRFSVIHQRNRGLGHARNRGVERATGEYLAFVDGDDLIPPAAFGAMLRTLENTGSDFAAGNVARLAKGRLSPSSLHQPIFEMDRLKTNVSSYPILFRDRTATNKIWRRSFWAEHELAFPEGVLYEDIAVVLSAYAIAEQVDVLSAVSYWWRIRDRRVGPSITQDRHDTRHIEDRFDALETARRAVVRHQPALKSAFFQAVFLSDLQPFFKILEEASPDYRRRFRQRCLRLLAVAGDDVLGGLPAIARLKYHLVEHGSDDELATVTAFERGLAAEHPTVEIDGRWYGDYPLRDLLPNHLYLLDQELALKSGIDRVWWEAGLLQVGGWAFLDLIDLSDPPAVVMKVWLQEVGSKRRVDLSGQPLIDDRLWRESKDPLHSYREGGFRASLDPTLLQNNDEWEESVWRFHVSVSGGGVVRKSRLGSPRSGPAERPELMAYQGDWVVSPTYNANSELTLRVEHRTVRLHEVKISGGELAVRLSGATAPEARLVLTSGAQELVYRLKKGVARLPPPTKASGEWRVWAEWGEKRVRVSVDDPSGERTFPDLGIVFHRTRYGNLSVIFRDSVPSVDQVHWMADGVLAIDGTCPDGKATEIVLSARGRSEQVRFPVSQRGGRFRATLDLAARSTAAGPLPLRAGTWDMALTTRTERGSTINLKLKLNHTLLSKLPLETTVEGKRYAFGDFAYDNPRLVVDDDRTAEERGAFPQRRLQTATYPAKQRQPLENYVLYESYSGKQFSDSPRAIYQALVRAGAPIDHRWVVRDRQVHLPSNEPVRHRGIEYFEAMARARYIVTNAHLPSWFKRRSGQTVVQTWHGTPLKKIGFDIEQIGFASANYKARLAQEVPNWTFLISPNAFATPILRSAFRFEGEVLETGYPRNDLFHQPGSEELAATVKIRLRTATDKRVILYAPTWRDNRYYSNGRYQLDMRLEVDALRNRLGEEHVLWVRNHPNVVDRISEDEFVIDAGDYPEVNELLLAADVVVTDYSSIMFDFANLRRPMAFFTYDLAEYRDNLRGFYFDFEQRAPGPLLATSDEVVDFLADLPGGFDRQAIDGFAQSFCAWDDGQAGKRVVQAVFTDL